MDQRGPGGDAVMIVDYMACLVALSRGLPAGGAHEDDRGITHATLRAQYRTVVACSLRRDSRNREAWSLHEARWVPR